MRPALLVLSFVGMFIYFFSQPVITQPQQYHHFADVRSFMGIPNAMDVLTNIFFLIVGLVGVLKVPSRSWSWFFISIALVAPGSAYYHWGPNNDTLVWDRLPMSTGFMALYVVLLSEHISEKFGKILFPALLLGVVSVFVWVITSDLRFYFWIQFSSFISIPIILFLFPSKYTHKSGYFVALGFYALAKVTEVKDREIFEMTNRLISGHSMKHILAAVGLMCLAWMVRVRRVADPALRT